MNDVPEIKELPSLGSLDVKNHVSAAPPEKVARASEVRMGLLQALPLGQTRKEPEISDAKGIAEQPLRPGHGVLQKRPLLVALDGPEALPEVHLALAAEDGEEEGVVADVAPALAAVEVVGAFVVHPAAGVQVRVDGADGVREGRGVVDTAPQQVDPEGVLEVVEGSADRRVQSCRKRVNSNFMEFLNWQFITFSKSTKRSLSFGRS